MPRARLIKPGFFTNEDIVSLPPETQLLFIGLWTLADKAGRLEDRPIRIKMQLFPASNYDVERMLSALNEARLIVRYVAEGGKYIDIPGFLNHQHPHPNEAASVIPAYDHVTSEQHHYTSTREKVESARACTIAVINTLPPEDGAFAPASAAKASSASGGAKPKPAAPKKRQPPALVDDAFLEELQADPAYTVFDVRLIAAKMARWCKQHGKQPTRNRLIGWLNKEDRPLGNSQATAKRDVGKSHSSAPTAEPVEEEQVRWTTEQYIEWVNQHEQEQEQSELRGTEPK